MKHIGNLMDIWDSDILNDCKSLSWFMLPKNRSRQQVCHSSKKIECRLLMKFQFAKMCYICTFWRRSIESLSRAFCKKKANVKRPFTSTLMPLTVQKRVSVIVTLSGQNTLSALIYPKLVVYPRGLCTHNEGSFVPPWGLQGAPQKMTPFIVVKLWTPIPEPGGIIWGSNWGTLKYPTTLH